MPVGFDTSRIYKHWSWIFFALIQLKIQSSNFRSEYQEFKLSKYHLQVKCHLVAKKIQISCARPQQDQSFSRFYLWYIQWQFNHVLRAWDRTCSLGIWGELVSKPSRTHYTKWPAACKMLYNTHDPFKKKYCRGEWKFPLKRIIACSFWKDMTKCYKSHKVTVSDQGFELNNTGEKVHPKDRAWHLVDFLPQIPPTWELGVRGQKVRAPAKMLNSAHGFAVKLIVRLAS